MSWDMQSCDTLGVCSSNSLYHSNMMAKNSDRPICEAQPLVWIPAADHTKGETLECTGITIPQVPHTYGVLGSKPYWMWGFEMGANDHGVVIGNEAEHSRDLGLEKTEGLLGMDLLRLGLERGATAQEAMKSIITLLSEYGQNRNASVLRNSRYENSFLILDKDEVWILETAGRRYVAKKVSNFHALGNTYSIGEVFDLASFDLESHARASGWLMPYEKFNFERAYSLHSPILNLATPRRRRLMQLAALIKKHDLTSLRSVFRDHYDGELIGPRWGASTGVFPTICRHSLDVNASQTAASMLTYYRDGIGLIVRQAYSQPCTSVYIPAYVGIALPELMSRGGGTFDDDSLWWLMDRLAKAVSIDYDRFFPDVFKEANRLEEDIDKKSEDVENAAAMLGQKGEFTKRDELLGDLMQMCALRAARFATVQYDNIVEKLHALGVFSLIGPRADFLKKYCSICKMKLL